MPSPDELLKMIVENIQNDGICCHIRKLFESGKGPLAYGLHTLIANVCRITCASAEASFFLPLL